VGVEPYVERTGVIWGGCGPLEVPIVQIMCLVRARVHAGSGSRNAWVAISGIDSLALEAPPDRTILCAPDDGL
jgi:hypothetical protein